MTIPAWFGWKKVLVVALFGAVLFLGSFLFSGKIGANGFWDSQHGSSQYEAASQYGGQTMVASYYGGAHAGMPTASGAPFDPSGYTAAHKSMPMGTQLLVNHAGSSVTVTVNDRGPYTTGRDLDLSQAAADTIGLTNSGVAPVEVTVLN